MSIRLFGCRFRLQKISNLLEKKNIWGDFCFDFFYFRFFLFFGSLDTIDDTYKEKYCDRNDEEIQSDLEKISIIDCNYFLSLYQCRKCDFEIAKINITNHPSKRWHHNVFHN